MSTSQKGKGVKSFLAEGGGKNRNYLFYPSAKSRRELKIKTLGVTFRGASAYYVQKSIAPQKQAVCRFSNEKIFLAKNLDENRRKIDKLPVFAELWIFGRSRQVRLEKLLPKF